MAVKITVTVRGASEVAALLKRLPKELAAKGLDAAVRGGTVKWQQEAKRTAPVWLGAPPELQAGPHRVGRKSGGRSKMVNPGNLRRNIRVAKIRGPAQLRGIESRYGITIPAAAYYWRFLEFGTSKMRAKPFLRPTFDRLGQAALADVAFAGSKWIDKYLRSGGKI